MVGTHASSPVRGLTWLTYLVFPEERRLPQKAQAPSSLDTVELMNGGQRGRRASVHRTPDPGGEGGSATPFSLPSLQKKLQDQRQRIVAEFLSRVTSSEGAGNSTCWASWRLEQELTEGREKFKTKAELARLARSSPSWRARCSSRLRSSCGGERLPGVESGYQDGGHGPASPSGDLESLFLPGPVVSFTWRRCSLSPPLTAAIA